MQGLHLVIVSGLSGSGKTYMLKCFEDLGYFCVDNLPPALLPTFVELCLQQGGEVKKVALGIDIRERGFFGDFIANLDRLKALGHSVELLFLDARDEILVRRFSESRRPHPLLPHAPVLEGVQLERERLLELRGRAERIIDTSDLTVHELKDLVTKLSVGRDEGRPMTVSLLSFGYKFGVPFEADLLFDVRFLRNPNFVAELKALTGEDAKVQAHVFDDPDAGALLDRLESLLQFLLPCYERERRSYLTIGIGCTGGRHRSVAIALQLRDRLAKTGCNATLRHRDLGKS
ncbi:MAG: RNase adapter RapZ [Nitrospirota bacterium]|nr:RNase adapter RapZ [Nitrospirota bacterium]MDE3242910.1 RNase adapter RapZ [Nitrospirota bacterium]